MTYIFVLAFLFLTNTWMINTIADCDPPPFSPSSLVVITPNQTSYTLYSSIHLTCPEGFTAGGGSDYSYCYPDGSWDPDPLGFVCNAGCPAPVMSSATIHYLSGANPNDDVSDYYNHDDVILYSCALDAINGTLVGPDTAVCDDGLWVPSTIPYCRDYTTMIPNTLISGSEPSAGFTSSPSITTSSQITSVNLTTSMSTDPPTTSTGFDLTTSSDPPTTIRASTFETMSTTQLTTVSNLKTSMFPTTETDSNTQPTTNIDLTTSLPAENSTAEKATTSLETSSITQFTSPHDISTPDPTTLSSTESLTPNATPPRTTVFTSVSLTFMVEYEILEIDGEEAIFTDNLTDPESLYYHDMEHKVISVADAVYGNIERYMGCTVYNFTSGSIIARFFIEFEETSSVEEDQLLNETYHQLDVDGGTLISNETTLTIEKDSVTISKVVVTTSTAAVTLSASTTNPQISGGNNKEWLIIVYCVAGMCGFLGLIVLVLCLSGRRSTATLGKTYDVQDTTGNVNHGSQDQADTELAEVNVFPWHANNSNSNAWLTPTDLASTTEFTVSTRTQDEYPNQGFHFVEDP